MNINKILGYVLLGIGLLLIVLPLFQTYNIFTAKSLPPELFSAPKMQASQANNPADIQQQLLEKALLAVMPVGSINKSLNLASWVLLTWALMLGGSKLAGLGIKLAKD